MIIFFQKSGEFVAVFYDQTFYIGQVLEEGGDGMMKVNFLKRKGKAVLL